MANSMKLGAITNSWRNQLPTHDLSDLIQQASKPSSPKKLTLILKTTRNTTEVNKTTIPKKASKKTEANLLGDLKVF